MTGRKGGYQSGNPVLPQTNWKTVGKSWGAWFPVCNCYIGLDGLEAPFTA